MTKDKLNLITKDLFNSKTEKDCLRMVKGKLYYNDKPLDSKVRDTVIGQAKELRNMDIYKLLCNELKYLANKKMYFEGDGEVDLLFGKAVLWTIDILEQKVDNLASM